MTSVLTAAGIPQRVLDMIPDVVDTCRECRAWQKTDPDVTPALELATQRNDKVEADILSYRDYLIWHIIDRADRWHAATVVPDRMSEA